MPGIANERELSRLIGEAIRTETEPDLQPGAEGAAGARLRAAKDMLDGIGGLGWSVIGFACGAAFWHFVGFWAFVSDVVLAGGPSGATATRAAFAGTMRVVERVVPAADAAAGPISTCTVLVLDRRSGQTSSRACDRTHVALPSDTFEGREDRGLPKSGFGGGPRHPGQR